MLRICQVQNVLPVLEVGHDLEGFGHFACGIPAHDLAHGGVNLDDFGVQAQWSCKGTLLPASAICAVR